MHPFDIWQWRLHIQELGRIIHLEETNDGHHGNAAVFDFGLTEPVKIDANVVMFDRPRGSKPTSPGPDPSSCVCIKTKGEINANIYNNRLSQHSRKNSTVKIYMCVQSACAANHFSPLSS